MPSFKDVANDLQKLTDQKQALILQRFFKTGPGEYGAGDIFLGIKVPVQRRVALQYTNLPLAAVSRLLKSKIHEYRSAALMILVKKYETAATSEEKKEFFNFYLEHSSFINNWDLVDLSAPKIIGDYLFNYWLSQGQPVKKFLLELAASDNLWVRRIAIISTFYFIRSGRSRETFMVAEKLLADKHDLIHKAVGWMLRESGARVSRQELIDFLESHYSRLPRTALRYAIEHFPKSERRVWLGKK